MTEKFSKKRQLKVATRQPSVRDLDDLFRIYIRLRDKMICQRCGKKTGKLEVAHFYSRAIKSTRWDPSNCALLCFSCHYCFAHREPAEFTVYWSEKFGLMEMARLRMRRADTSKTDRNLIRLFLEGEIKKLKGGSNGDRKPD